MGKEAGTLNSSGYWKVTVAKKQMYAHRVVWYLVENIWPEFYVNHENMDRADNKFSNLSLETHTSNSQFRKIHSDNQSGITGVSWIETRGCLYANAFYRQNGKPFNKRFSVIKYGREIAWQMAVDFRNEKIKELNEKGCKFNEIC